MGEQNRLSKYGRLCILFALGVPACSKRTDDLTTVPEVSRTVGSAGPHDDVKAATRNGNRFEWHLSVYWGALPEKRTSIRTSREKLELPFRPWECSFEAAHEGGADQEFGYLTCQSRTSQDRVGTMVLCAGAADADCKSGTLRLRDETGAAHTLELTCGCQGIEASTLWAEPRSAPNGLEGSKALAEPERHFIWKLDVRGPTGNSSNMPISLGEEIPATIHDWECASEVLTVPVASATRAEAGQVRCRSLASGQLVETQIVCRENKADPSYCNVRNIRVATRSGDFTSILLRCKSPDNRCW